MLKESRLLIFGSYESVGDIMNKNVSGIITAIILLVMLAGSAGAAPHEMWIKTFGGTDDDVLSVQETLDGGYIPSDSTNDPPYPQPPTPKRKIDNIIGIIGLLVASILGWLTASKVRKNRFLRAGAILLVISFALFMLFLATAEGDYGMIWILFISPIIFIASLILLIIGMIKPKK